MLRSGIKSRLDRFRFALAVVLSLHLGLGQAAMAQPARVTSPETTQQVAPCHGGGAEAAAIAVAEAQAESRPSAPTPHSCCDPGHCHCAAVHAIAFAPTPVLTTTLAASVAWTATPLRTHVETPDLRPPIH